MLNFNAPLNSVSFGQVSTSLLREAYASNTKINVLPIGQGIDLAAYSIDKNFGEWIKANLNQLESFSRKNKTFKLWHLNGALESYGEKQSLFSFYELDEPTKTEINIVNNLDKVFFSSNHAVDLFRKSGCKNVYYIPLGFDSFSFSKTNKTYFNDGRITFNLCGKLEKRKHHGKIIKAWLKKYGNNPKYFLQCAIYNPFIDEKTNIGIVSNFLEGKKYFNINFLGTMPQNNLYNDFLNSGDIIIGMSGGEGWGLPEFHSIALGKHGVILNEHAYKDWANKDNSVLVNSNSKIDAEDGLFFNKNSPFNQGQIFDFDENDFLSACDIAINKFQLNPINQNGLMLQEKFTYKNTFDKILSLV